MMPPIGLFQIVQKHSKELIDVMRNGKKSIHYGRVMARAKVLDKIEEKKKDRYNKMPKWLRLFYRNPNK